MFAALAVILAATGAVYFGAAVVRGWAVRHGALDIPNGRSSHFRPTPRGGGLAIVLVTLSGWLVFGISTAPRSFWTAMGGYACGAALVALVSWLDDLHSLSAANRMTAHVAAAVLAMFALGYWQELSLPTGHTAPLGIAGAALTLLWIVGLTNAYNFMDGSDGLAGSQAIIAGLGWACLGWLAAEPLVVELALLLAAGGLGFLPHNWPPAKIFLGDVGSAFFGYSFAVLPLLVLRQHGPLASIGPILGLLLLWPFIFDTALTFLGRLRRGENVLAAHRSHLYQRLMIAGHSHRTVLLLYSAMAIPGAVLAVAWFLRPAPTSLCALLLLPSAAYMLHRFVVATERRAAEHAAQQRRLILPPPQRKAA